MGEVSVINLIGIFIYSLVIDTSCIITYFNLKVCIYLGKCLLVKDIHYAEKQEAGKI